MFTYVHTDKSAQAHIYLQTPTHNTHSNLLPITKKISFKFLYNFPLLQSSLHKPFELKEKEKEKSNLSPDLLQEFLVT